MIKLLLSCEYNIDTACVELRYSDGSALAIDCIEVEDTFAKSPAHRTELDYLIYNDPAAYADLILNGDAGCYLKAVTTYRTDEALS